MTSEFSSTVRAIAPAKVNLFLGIGKRNPDGYHDATTVMHALSLHDTVALHVAPAAPGAGLSVAATAEWHEAIEPIEIPDDRNLACKAVVLLARKLGRTQDEQVDITLQKHIPYQAGLGGGSSDAAAALVAVASAWGVDPHSAPMHEAAQELGVDVRFFLHGGCSLLEGRGDEFVRCLQPMRQAAVLVHPGTGVSTAQAYGLFDENPLLPDEELLKQVRDAQTADEVPLFNNLDGPAERLLPEVREIRERLQASPGVEGALLCGSGSAVFAVCADLHAAHALTAREQARGNWARSTSFSPVGAALLPTR